MLSHSVSRQVRCVFATQVIFITTLVVTGCLVIIPSALELYHILWSCPVLNIYYAVSWLCLVLGIVKLLLGLSGALFLLIQPHCVDPKLSSVVLVGPTGSLGQIDAPAHRLRANSISLRPSTQLWTLRLNKSHHSSSATAAVAAASGGEGGGDACAACRQGCCSTLGWVRPFGLLLALIIIGELVAVFLTLGFESRALNPISGIHSQLQSMFVEAKTDLSSQLQDHEPATACWDTLERDFQCCGATGYMEWLVDHSPPQLPSLANSSTVSPLPSSPAYHSDAVKFLRSRCGCPSDASEGNCVDVTLLVEPDNRNVTFSVLSRSCAQVITDTVLHGFIVLKVVFSVSLCLTLLSFIVSLCVTVRVASQGSSAESNMMATSRMGHNLANVQPTSTLEVPRAAAPPTTAPAPAPPKFSTVAMPAIRAFSINRTEPDT